MNPGVVWINLVIVALGLAVLMGLVTTWAKGQPFTTFVSSSVRAIPYTLTAMLTIGLTFWLIFPLGLTPSVPRRAAPAPALLCDGAGFIGNPQTMLYYPPGTDLPLLSPRERCFGTRTSAEVAGYKPARN